MPKNMTKSRKTAQTSKGGMEQMEPAKMTIAQIKNELIEMGYDDDVFNPDNHKMLKMGWIKLLRERRAQGARPLPPARSDRMVANAAEAFRRFALDTSRSPSPEERVVPRTEAPVPKSKSRLAVEKAAALPLPPRK